MIRYDAVPNPSRAMTHIDPDTTLPSRPAWQAEASCWQDPRPLWWGGAYSERSQHIRPRIAAARKDFIFAGYVANDVRRMKRAQRAGEDWMPSGPHGTDDSDLLPTSHDKDCTCRRCRRKAAEARRRAIEARKEDAA